MHSRLTWLAGTALALVASAASAQQAASSGDQIEEIIVTAQRREQTLMEVPQSISVVGGEALERQAAVSFMDYAALIPGFTVTQDNPGESRLILRGINTGSVGATVANYIDDAPFGSSGSLSNGGVLAGDFDTFDVARVEVLRGPQGTLYGSNALGGVLKFITAAPSMAGFEGKAQAGVEDVKSGGTGYTGNAMLNVPLGETLAFRASGFYRKNAGYVDAVGRTGSNINRSASYGGRASLLFNASENVSVRLFALAQNIEVDSPGSFEVNPLTLKPVSVATGARQGDRRTRYERIADRNDVDYRLYSGTLNWNVGFADLVSVTSYSKQHQNQFADATPNALRPTVNAIYAPTAPNTVGFGQFQTINVKKFTQEVRLASPDSDKFEWLVGGYYTDEKTSLFQRFDPFTLSTQAFIPRPVVFGGRQLQEFVIATIDANYEETAAFGSATYHLTDQFEITAGARYSHNKQDSVQDITQLGTPNTTIGDSGESVFTWSVSPRYEISEHASLYGRVAKGYRPGGPNFVPAGAGAGFPTEFDADTLVSYEAGLRAETADRRFSFDGSVYYLDWKDILITSVVVTAAGPAGVNANGREARSYGFELTGTARPISGLSLVANLAYTNARLRDDTTPPAGGTNGPGGLKGDRLPYTPEWSGNLSADYEWDLTGDMTAFVGGNIRFLGDQTAGFSAAYRTAFGQRIKIDGYQTIDLRGGIVFDNKLTVSAYVKNLTDEYGLTSAGGYPFTVATAIGGTGTPLLRAASIRPRTMGFTVGYEF